MLGNVRYSILRGPADLNMAIKENFEELLLAELILKRQGEIIFIRRVARTFYGGDARIRRIQIPDAWVPHCSGLGGLGGNCVRAARPASNPLHTAVISRKLALQSSSRYAKTRPHQRLQEPPSNGGPRSDQCSGLPEEGCAGAITSAHRCDYRYAFTTLVKAGSNREEIPSVPEVRTQRFAILFMNRVTGGGPRHVRGSPLPGDDLFNNA
ncbi:hypothetical protein EVAR_38850_1 [Eumeta japonica]|uniref:Uncharacterized protein n=1 Tax=Eumeta variegata TaxID=151549 RepID=A0A4C1X4H1_EUMVA|nr:hypothetical protein EVAR_38850_1 [Eumeta japonica]